MMNHDKPTQNELTLEANKSEVDRRVRNQISQFVTENYPELHTELLEVLNLGRSPSAAHLLETTLTTFSELVDELTVIVEDEIHDDSFCQHCNGSGGGLPPMECTYCHGTGSR